MPALGWCWIQDRLSIDLEDQGPSFYHLLFRLLAPAAKYEKEARKYWDLFYKRNKDKVSGWRTVALCNNTLPHLEL